MATHVGTKWVERGVGQTLERAAELFGDRTGVVDGDRRITYAQLARRVAGLGGGLRELGVERGSVVGVLSLNSLEHLECWLGIPRCGAVLNDLNYRLAPAELEFVLDDCEALVLIVDDTFAELGAALAAGCGSVRHLIHCGRGDPPEGAVRYEDVISAQPSPDLGASDRLAGIFYTGGTTGRPKGAMLTHANLVANAKHVLIAVGHREDDVYLHAAPMFHLADGGTTYAITWVGGRHVTIPAFDPELWLRTVAAERVTRSVLVPTMINMLVNHPTLAEHDVSSLQTLTYGASPMPEELLRRAMKALPCEWLQGYGMTEAAPVVSMLPEEDHRRGAAGEEPFAARLRSAGLPVVGVEAEVHRPDGSRCEVGECGEIWVRGPNVMQGYWNRPEETAAALDDEGWYHSGDAAYADADGYLYVVDRVKDMIISGGENVYSIEVENAIYRHDSVLEAAVFGVPDERWGEQVHVVIVLKPKTTVTEDQIVAHCRELIAGYKLPRSIEFRTEPLPKSGAGKILKRELREPYWEGHERQVS